VSDERRIVLRIVPGELEHAIDHALPLLPAGVRVDEAANELVAVGEPHELPPVERLASELGALLLQPPSQE
jgi:hypothetical protein